MEVYNFPACATIRRDPSVPGPSSIQCPGDGNALFNGMLHHGLEPLLSKESAIENGLRKCFLDFTPPWFVHHDAWHGEIRSNVGCPKTNVGCPKTPM